MYVSIKEPVDSRGSESWKTSIYGKELIYSRAGGGFLYHARHGVDTFHAVRKALCGFEPKAPSHPEGYGTRGEWADYLIHNERPYAPMICTKCALKANVLL